MKQKAALIDAIILHVQFSAMYVLRFAMAVRRVQAAARQFMARNRARIKSLERTWDAYEYHYISVRVYCYLCVCEREYKYVCVLCVCVPYLCV